MNLVNSQDDFVVEYGDIVARAARREHQQTHLFEVDDLIQEVWLGLLPYWKRLHSQGPGFVFRAAQNVASQYAQRERIDVMYYKGAFIYTPDMVRGELEVGAWLSADHEGDWDMRIDIQNAYDQLNDKEQHVLFEKYMRGISPDRDGADRKTLDRSIDKMCHWLNGKAGMEHVPLETVADWA